jgi:hypothetical protein
MAVALPRDLAKALAAGGWPVVVLLLVLSQVVPQIEHASTAIDQANLALARIEAICVYTPKGS